MKRGKSLMEDDKREKGKSMERSGNITGIKGNSQGNRSRREYQATEGKNRPQNDCDHDTGATEKTRQPHGRGKREKKHNAVKPEAEEKKGTGGRSQSGYKGRGVQKVKAKRALLLLLTLHLGRPVLGKRPEQKVSSRNRGKKREKGGRDGREGKMQSTTAVEEEKKG